MALTRLPGFIDIHVHLRDPGATHKEDFVTGTRAALKGGFTFLLDMPNNPSMPTVSQERLQEKIRKSAAQALCDMGFYYGTDGNNIDTFASAGNNSHVFGLKLYCNHTTGELLVDDEKTLEQVFLSWKSEKPVLLHAEGNMLDLCLELARLYGRRVHVCHVATAEDLTRVKQAKLKGQKISAGVTPHHLFLTRDHVTSLGNFALVKPGIGASGDREALWEGLRSGVIDLVESDHAPHTKEEKVRSTPFYGVPGLETTLGLLLKAVHEHILTLQHVLLFLYDNPRKIFSIPTQLDTYIELDPEKPFVVGEMGYETKCGWSPFDGWELYGAVETVVLRNKHLVSGGKVV